jgi:nucleoid-associated protein YgaU
MQQIERYGVIALVFLLVTIVAVSFWGDSKSPGFWSRLTGKSDAKKEQADKAAQVADLGHVTDPSLPLSPTPTPPQVPVVSADIGAPSATPKPGDAPSSGTGTFPGPFQASPGAGIVSNQSTGTPGGIPVPPGFGPGVNPPKPEPQPKTAPIPAASNEYVVQKGDSLARIAAEKLGSEKRWNEILTLNPGLEPRNLGVGKTIHLPDASGTSLAKATAKKEPASDKKIAGLSKPDAKKATKETAKETSSPKSSTSVYVVQKGDHMTTIAQKVLGDARRWKEIVAANPGIDPNKIAVGDKLKLPGAKHEPLVASADVKSASNSATKSPTKPTSSPDSTINSAAKNSELAMVEKPHVR